MQTPEEHYEESVHSTLAQVRLLQVWPTAQVVVTSESVHATVE